MSGILAAFCGAECVSTSTTSTTRTITSHGHDGSFSIAVARDQASAITVVCGGDELFANQSHSECCGPTDTSMAETRLPAPSPVRRGESEALAPISEIPSEGGEDEEKREEEEGEGVWLRLYLKASEQAADGASRQRLTRLAAALSESSSSSAWFTR
jgi:hypothetical protein